MPKKDDGSIEFKLNTSLVKFAFLSKKASGKAEQAYYTISVTISQVELYTTITLFQYLFPKYSKTTITLLQYLLHNYIMTTITL